MPKNICFHLGIKRGFKNHLYKVVGLPIFIILRFWKNAFKYPGARIILQIFLYQLKNKPNLYNRRNIEEEKQFLCFLNQLIL